MPLTNLFIQLVYLAPLIFVALLTEAAFSSDSVPARSARLNVGVTVLYWLATFTLGVLVSVWLVRAVALLPGGPLFRPPQPTTALGVLGWAVVVVALRDFVGYWCHRAQHHFEWLWVEHALHHSDESMNATTTWRHHWLESSVQTVLITAPIVYLIAPDIRAMAVASIISDLLNLFIHMAVRLHLGRWAWVIGNPQLHRIHHSASREHRDRNFASVFPIVDVIFGTYHAPGRDEFPPTGLYHHERIASLWDASVLPLRLWWRNRHLAKP